MNDRFNHFAILTQVDVGDFLRFKSCVLYTQLDNPEQPLVNVEVVAHVTRPELRKSEVIPEFHSTALSDARLCGFNSYTSNPFSGLVADNAVQRTDLQHISLHLHGL